MSRQNGYTVTIKAFIPAPKDSFAKQAAAATIMAELASAKVITPGFVEVARILDVSGKYGSADLPEVAPADTSGDTDPADDGQTDIEAAIAAAGGEPANAPPTGRQRRSSSQT